jgi:hypothetical protein
MITPELHQHFPLPPRCHRGVPLAYVLRRQEFDTKLKGPRPPSRHPRARSSGPCCLLSVHGGLTACARPLSARTSHLCEQLFNWRCGMPASTAVLQSESRCTRHIHPRSPPARGYGCGSGEIVDLGRSETVSNGGIDSPAHPRHPSRLPPPAPSVWFWRSGKPRFLKTPFSSFQLFRQERLHFSRLSECHGF